MQQSAAGRKGLQAETEARGSPGLRRSVGAPPNKQSKHNQHHADENYKQSGVGEPSEGAARARKAPATLASSPR
jgi:hypothetical protein